MRCGIGFGSGQCLSLATLCPVARAHGRGGRHQGANVGYAPSGRGRRAMSDLAALVLAAGFFLGMLSLSLGIAKGCGWIAESIVLNRESRKP